ncbi:HU domain-containing protein [Aestuariivivens insulae]|uniref:HU domain-containing protein n=1 Tax=Aestuariivivens insulae TaxID=1621988 RepID=UPI00293E0681|nr:SPOR domain-containing protein [Aestuariivivens insulae]
MQLETYISDLLYRYECVTIPGFGAFLTRRVSATIDESTHAFFPPKKVLSFNEQIQKNDGLLAHYIAEVEKIPFEVANKKIAKRVKLLKSYLTQGETLTFKNIGEIVFNNEGKILFEPTYQLNYLTDAFGLSKFESTAVVREVYKETAEAVESVIPIGVTPEKRKSKPYLRYAAVALIALTLGGFGVSSRYNKIETHNQLAQEEANQQLETKIQEATFSLNTLPAITLNAIKQTGNYHIVAGAFRVEENSIKMIDQLKALGYPARYAGVNKYGLHEVIYASYEKGSDALQAVRDIRKAHNKDAWIKVDRDISERVSHDNTNALNEQDLEKLEEIALNSELNTETTPADDFDFRKSPNIIPIVKDINGINNGFYLVLDAFKDAAQRDAFIKTLKSKGYPSIRFFFDAQSDYYFVYNETFNDLKMASKALKLKAESPFHDKPFIVKVEN